MRAGLDASGRKRRVRTYPYPGARVGGPSRMYVPSATAHAYAALNIKKTHAGGRHGKKKRKKKRHHHHQLAPSGARSLNEPYLLSLYEWPEVCVEALYGIVGIAARLSCERERAITSEATSVPYCSASWL